MHACVGSDDKIIYLWRKFSGAAGNSNVFGREEDALVNVENWKRVLTLTGHTMGNEMIIYCFIKLYIDSL